MLDNVQAFLSFDHLGQSYILASREEAVELLEVFRSNVEWLTQVRFNDKHVQEFKQSLSEELNKLIATTAEDNSNPSWVASQFVQFFSKYQLPIEGTPYFEFIEKLKQEYNTAVAFGAAVSKVNWYIDTNSPWFFTGSVLRILYENGISAEAGLAARLSMEKQVSKFRDIVTEAQKTHETSNYLLNEQLNSNDRKSLESGRRILRHVRFLHQKRAAKSREAISVLEKTTAAYREQMRLKAPVEYWLEKAAKHRDQAVKYRDSLIKWGWKAAAIVLFFLGLLAWLTHSWASNSAPIASFIGPATIGVIVTTIAFWAARIVVRLYMSEHHLAIDAEERAIMVQTYLALIENGAATETERALVLAPLFKSSSDGIVKDDAAPDLSPASFLSKALSKP